MASLNGQQIEALIMGTEDHRWTTGVLNEMAQQVLDAIPQGWAKDGSGKWWRLEWAGDDVDGESPVYRLVDDEDD